MINTRSWRETDFEWYSNLIQERRLNWDPTDLPEITLVVYLEKETNPLGLIALRQIEGNYGIVENLCLVTGLESYLRQYLCLILFQNLTQEAKKNNIKRLVAWTENKTVLNYMKHICQKPKRIWVLSAELG